jgi:glycosyltransferase involved in cell wall biosynthesis
MILLDSLYINNSGGKVLLNYLVATLEKEKINCFYLFDDRCSKDYGFVPKERKQFMKASLFKRHLFYKKNKHRFSKVFCFGNLPPTLKLSVPVFTYFHQPLFLSTPKSASIFIKLKLFLQTKVLNLIKSKTDVWLVQSDLIKTRLAQRYRIKLMHIKLIPFYPPLIGNSNDSYVRNEGFVYVSNGSQHKNHKNLIEAFCNYFDEFKRGVLHITVSEKFPELILLIERKINQRYPIVNHGFVDRNELIKLYQENKYLIFPSLAESFGLGLVEAIENGCDVIGADLPYTYAVCNPSIVFDPLDVKDIKRAMIESQSTEVKKTEQLVFNQIDDLIDLLK